ncbi:MAG: DUF1428 domain-containing protein [Planctomycetota bacterium]
MSNYIDGFTFPIPSDRIAEYRKVATAVAEIYREHGALEYVEFIGDDMLREGPRSFPEMVGASEKDSVVFGWISYESRAARDMVNERIESDPRLAELVAPLMDPSSPIFNPAQMAFAGFQAFIRK